MKSMKEKLLPSFHRFLKSVRLQRGSGWRAVRVGVGLVVVIVVWVYLLSPTHTLPPIAHDNWSSGSPSLQVAAPIRGRGAGELGGEGIDSLDTWRRTNVKIANKIHPVKVEDEDLIEPKGGLGGGGGQILIEEEEEKTNKKATKKKKKLEEEEEEEQEQDTNPRYNMVRESNVGLGKEFRDKEIFPRIFPKRRLILPGDTKLLEEEDEDEEEEEEVEEEGKWKGRNKEENDNHAMEEEDDVGVGGKDEDNDEHDNDDVVEEDVGGEAIKRRRRRVKSMWGNVNNDNNDKNAIVDPQNNIEENGQQGQRYKNTMVDPKNDLKENVKEGQRLKNTIVNPKNDLKENGKQGHMHKDTIVSLDLKENGNEGQRYKDTIVDPKNNIKESGNQGNGNKNTVVNLDLKENGNQGHRHKNTAVDLKNDLKENGNQVQRSEKENDPPEPDLRGLDLVAVEEEMRQRRSRVKQVCARYGLGPNAPPGATRKVKYPPTPAYETFYIDRGDRLAWCPVYKAASTSWLYGFLSLAGISESYVKNTKEQVSTVARRVWPALAYDVAKEAVETCVKAMVVRHPFERLVSAFRDKLERVAGGEAHGTAHFYQKYGKKIVEKYRKRDKVAGNVGTGGRDSEDQRVIRQKREGREGEREGESENQRNIEWKREKKAGIGEGESENLRNIEWRREKKAGIGEGESENLRNVEWRREEKARIGEGESDNQRNVEWRREEKARIGEGESENLRNVEWRREEKAGIGEGESENQRNVEWRREEKARIGEGERENQNIREKMEVKDTGNSGNQRTRRGRRAETRVLLDIRGDTGDGSRRTNDGIRQRDEAWSENIGNRGSGDDKDSVPRPLPPPLRYTNALDDTALRHPQPPPPAPPPPRYKHVLEDTPQPPPPPPQPPPAHLHDEFDDSHQPPPQRYQHVLIEASPLQQQESESTPEQGKEPTFREFVRYLIDTDLTLYADDHWMPYHLSCTPCLVDFDVIAKFETLNRDQAFLLKKTNLQGKLNFTWQHLTKGSKTGDVVRRYFADVSKEDLLSLYKKYRLDFEMFDYSVDEYLSFAKSG